ncbi:ubiquitin-associated protein 2 [Grus japonensis]|uniref:Ubiquitin-associated protein 2 n=1 Tax=Grus japonensis TaxID=30415 RepID=A0ABC9XYP1_GRUJA
MREGGDGMRAFGVTSRGGGERPRARVEKKEEEGGLSETVRCGRSRDGGGRRCCFVSALGRFSILYIHCFVYTVYDDFGGQ